MTASAISLPRPEKQPGPVLFAPLLDVLVAGGGLSLLLLFVSVCLNFKYSPIWFPTAIIVAGCVVNNPHYAATYYRVYRSTAEVRKYFVSAVLVPIGLVALCAVGFWSPLVVAPWFCKAYIITSGYHYSGQSYGISLIYSRKSGFRFTPLMKLAIGLPIFLSYFYSAMHNECQGEPQFTFYGVLIPQFNLSSFALLPILVGLAVGINAYIFLNFFLWFKNRQFLPPIVHVVVVSHSLWFLFWGFQTFQELVPFFHCFQYLLITTYFQMQELIKKGSFIKTDALSYLRSPQFLRYYGILIVVGAILFYAIPYLMHIAGIGSWYFTAAMVISFVNLHHFILDGEIWKLRKPEIGKSLVG